MGSRSVKDIGIDSIIYIVLFLAALLCLYPFYYIFIYTISSPGEAAKGGIYLLPAGFSLVNYQQILAKKEIFNAALISILRTVVGTGLTVFCSSLFGYLVTKKELIFRRFFYRAIVITMYLNAGLIPTYLIYKALHLNNNFLVYIIPGAVSAFYVILIKTYIESLPVALEESAMMDGARYWRIFIKIILPLCIPILATVAIFAAVGQWNSWQDNFFFVSNSKLKVLQLVLWEILNSAQSLADSAKSGGQANVSEMANRVSPVSIRMTISMITTLPIILVYPFLQRYFIKGILIGAVKG